MKENEKLIKRALIEHRKWFMETFGREPLPDDPLFAMKDENGEPRFATDEEVKDFLAYHISEN